MKAVNEGFFLSVILLFSLTISSVAAEPEVVTVYEYHQFPPIVVSKANRTGLTFSLARYMTNKSVGRFNFEVDVLSMGDLHDILKAGQSAVVFFVSPIWFSDADMKQYLWTDELLVLRDEIISLKETPFEFDFDKGFEGHVIGGIEGYTYPILDDLVSMGKATRIDAKNDLDNLKKLKSGEELDAIIVNGMPLKFYSQLLGIQNELHLSETPSGIYQVRILLTKDLSHVHEFLQKIIAQFEKDTAWKTLLHLYLP